jgi:hypothetical protein
MSEVGIYVEGIGYEKIYDYAPQTLWRPLDTMQFKTFINSKLPRKLLERSVKTISPPWADKLNDTRCCLKVQPSVCFWQSRIRRNQQI